MDELGTMLKTLREKKHLSLKTVYKDTGISDSRLSKIEHSERKCPLNDFFVLLKYYGVSPIDCLISCGLLSDSDVSGYCQTFSEADKLTDKDKSLVQNIIYRLVQKEV